MAVTNFLSLRGSSVQSRVASRINSSRSQRMERKKGRNEVNRTVKNRNTPNVKPVEKVSLSEKHVKVRLAAVVLLLLLGAGALAYGVAGWLGGESGWREIEVSSSAEMNYGEEFVFLYDIGSSGVSAATESRALEKLYTEASVQAYRLFNNDQLQEGVNNVYYINHHPNERITVDEALYEAFAQIQETGSRYLYLAPAYEIYDNLFYSNDDSELVNFDPQLNEELREDFQEIADFASDPEAIDLELLGDNQICLKVSEEYLAYANEEYITDLIDFYWMKNAFIVDYLADVMTKAGYTAGSLSSYDGFTRNLDERDVAYSFNVYDRSGQKIYPAAVMEYSGSRSIVFLRDYPMNSLDDRRYYERKNGEIRTPYLSLDDASQKQALHNLVAYSDEDGCARLLLLAAPLYIADRFEKEAAAELASDNVYFIFSEEQVLNCSDPQIVLNHLYQGEDVSYQAVLFE